MGRYKIKEKNMQNLSKEFILEETKKNLNPL